MKKTIKSNAKKLTVSAAKDLYDKDFYKWTKSQANLLQKGEFTKLDIENLIEEVESLGRSEKRTLSSQLEILLMHMLKAEYQPEKHGTSWDLSIKYSRNKSKKTLDENPSLKPKLKEILKDAYSSARIDAALETGLEEDTFPEECPWSLKHIFPNLDKKYL